MKRRLLVLGGTDFIGERLAARLASDESLQVVLAGRAANKQTPDAPYERIHCDPADAATLGSLITDGTTIVNCVAGDAATMLRSATALFAIATSKGSPTILQLSTIAAYGSISGVVDESAPLLGDVDAYAAARAQVDRMAQDYGCVCLRPGIIYGPGSVRWSGQVGRLLLARRLGDLGAAGDGICNLIFIDDLLSAMALVLAKPDVVTAAVNLCSSERLTWNEYLVRYAKALGAVPVKRITQRSMKLETKLIAPPLKIAEMVLGQSMARRLQLPELISPSLLRVCSQDIFLDSAKAERSLAMTWTPVTSGLQQAADWYQSSYRQH